MVLTDLQDNKQRNQILLLYISTICGVLLGVLASIVNTRFLSPADYGDVRYVQNIINFIVSLLIFGYFLSGSRLIALSNNKIYSRRVKGMMVIILLFCCTMLVLGLLICYLFHFNTPKTATLFLISLPVCFSPLLLNYIEQTTIGDNQIGRLSLTRILPYLLYVPIAYFVYRQFGATSTKMILLQWGIYTFVYVCIILSTKPLFSKLKGIWTELQKENHNYGIQLYIGSLVMVATNYLAGISLGYFNTDNSEVGFYTLALTVTTPLATLPTIVGTAYFKKFTTQSRIPSKVIWLTIIITAITCIGFLLLIHPMVKFLYTEKYAIVATYASLLAIGFCIHGLGDVFNRYLCSQGKGTEIRNASIINGVVKVTGYMLLVALFNTNGAIATTILADLVYFITMLYYYYRFIRRNTESEH